MARVLVAGRLSQGSGDGPDRIERDDKDARAWAEREGHEVIETTADYVSGSSDPFKRTQLGKWLTKPELVAQWDVLVVSKLDRLGRSARHLRNIRDWADTNGKRLHVIGQNLQWPIPKGDFGSKLQWELLAVLAEWELDTITERQAAARSKVHENGGFVSKPPYGFEVVGERYSRTIQPIPELAPVLRELITHALRGDTLLAMAQWLDAQGVAPRAVGGTSWAPGSVRRVLQSTSLKGRTLQTYTKDGTSTKVWHKHTGLITAAEWDQLQAVMDRGATARTTGRKRNGAETALLTNVITCAKCGGPMYRVYSVNKRKNGEKHSLAYYRCKGKDQQPSTCRNMINLDVAEGFVHMAFAAADTVDIASVNPALAESGVPGLWADFEVTEQVPVPGNDHREEISDVNEEMARVLAAKPSNYLAQLATLDEELRRLQGLPVEPSQVITRATGQTIGQVWASLGDTARRRFLLASGVKVKVAPGGDLEVVGDPSQITGALHTIAA